MAKRSATSDINHDNWDRDEEPEEAGTFSRADHERLKKRVIKVAKRRNLSSTQNDDDKPKVFGDFSFSKTSTTTTSGSPGFGFLTNLIKSETPKTNGTATDTENKTDKLEEYYAKLTGLNEGVLKWIEKHVTNNPLINLQPIFKDYDRYIAELEKLKSEAESIPKTPQKIIPTFSFGIPTTTGATTSKASSELSFGTSAPIASSKALNSSSQFSFGIPASAPTTTSSTAAASPMFSFGPKPTSFGATSLPSTATFESTSEKSSFSFGTPSSNGKFSFTSTVIKPADDQKESSPTQNAEEHEEPPKVEFTPVVEDGHVYTTRCKVFVKKGDSFGDRGVGSLYVKPVPESEKFQVFVRAETNLGNLLCNFILSDSIPIQRMGKKDVMLVCIPTPDAKPPPLPILLRVKSSEEADELLEVLQKHKK